MFSADWTLRIAPQFEFTEFHFEGIEKHETADQRFTLSDNQLQCFGCLHQSDDPRQYAEYACFGATGRGSRRRRLWKQAAVARSPEMWREDASLALEAED